MRLMGHQNREASELRTEAVERPAGSCAREPRRVVHHVAAAASDGVETADGEARPANAEQPPERQRAG